jgi:hypothetical protein
MISGREFANISRWIFDTRYSDKAMSMVDSASGDLVFINGDLIDVFLQRKKSNLFSKAKKFNYFIHNSDLAFDEARLYKLLPHAMHIYAINTTIRHPQLTTIPIGFADKTLDFVKTFKPKTVERDIEIYLNVSVGSTNEHRYRVRRVCAEAFVNDPRVVAKTNRSLEDYFDDLCRSKFVLCPQGTGIDTHRVYEAILCGATPVVLHSTLDHLYQRLPVCILDSWTDPLYVPSSVTQTPGSVLALNRFVPE